MSLVINKVSASNGWQWINEGFRYFVQAKIVWIMTVFMVAFYPLIFTKVAPFLRLLVFFLLPLFAAGLAIACRDIEQGKNMSMRYLFKALESPNKFNVIKYGILLLIMILVAQLLVSIVISLMGVNPEHIKNAMNLLNNPEKSPIEIIQNSPVLMKYLMITMVAMIPVVIINFLAPIVLVFSQMTALEAVISCFKAGLKNLSAFVVYAISYLVLALIIIVIMKLLSFVLLAIFGEQSTVSAVVYLLLISLSFLSLAAISYCSAYVAYKDIFLEKS